jgi:hypothetical protein
MWVWRREGRQKKQGICVVDKVVTTFFFLSHVSKSLRALLFFLVVTELRPCNRSVEVKNQTTFSNQPTSFNQTTATRVSPQTIMPKRSVTDLYPSESESDEKTPKKKPSYPYQSTITCELSSSCFFPENQKVGLPSKTFLFTALNHSWALFFEKEAASPNQYGVFLLNKEEYTVYAEYTIKIRGLKNESSTVVIHFQTDRLKKLTPRHGYGFTDGITVESLSKLTSLRCEIEIKMTHLSSYYQYKKQLLESNSLTQSLSAFVNQEELSDVSIKVGEENKLLKAHFLILASQSEVLRGLFRSGMQETQTRILDMSSYPENVVLELLQCLYSGTVPSDDFLQLHMATFYALVHEYQFERCLVCCETILLRWISSDKSPMSFEEIYAMVKILGTEKVRLDCVRCFISDFTPSNLLKVSQLCSKEIADDICHIKEMDARVHVFVGK